MDYDAAITLKRLIELLEAEDPKREVRHGFAEPSSYRGFYDRIAFAPAFRVTAESMLAHARSAVGAMFTGYKGGEYTMSCDTQVYISDYGRCDESDTITEAVVRRMFGKRVHDCPACTCRYEDCDDY